MFKNRLNQVRSLAAKASKGAKAAAASAAVAVMASPAHAAITTTDIETTISDVAAAGAVIGLAIVVMHYGIKAYKWIKAAG